jgi:hypothetical protein
MHIIDVSGMKDFDLYALCTHRLGTLGEVNAIILFCRHLFFNVLVLHVHKSVDVWTPSSLQDTFSFKSQHCSHGSENELFKVQ